MAGLEVTSIARELGWTGEAAKPSTVAVAEAGRRFTAAFERRLGEAAALHVTEPRRVTEPPHASAAYMTEPRRGTERRPATTARPSDVATSQGPASGAGA